MTSLRLSPEDEATCRTSYERFAAARDACVKAGDQVTAKKYRQLISRLYEEYKGKQLPEPVDASVPTALVLDPDDLDRLQSLSDELQGGSDRERDYGHRLWLVIGNIKGMNGGLHG